MDERLEYALDFSNFMITFDNQKRVLKEKYKESLIFYFNKGQFTVTKEFIAFIQTMISFKQNEIVIIDDNDEPIQIDDLKIFMIEIVDVYFQASNAYFAEYKKLIQQRSVKGILDL